MGDYNGLALFFVGLGGGFGAILRYSITRLLSAHNGGRFHLATFLINSLGTFCLGFLSGFGAGDAKLLFLGTGMMGGFTTFSTFNHEILRIHGDGHPYHAGLYAGLTLSAGLTLGFLGMAIGYGLSR